MRRLIDILVTAIAPLTWGTTYLLTTHALPTGRPLLDAVARSLPVGLLILAFTRQLPRGSWWWRSAVLAALNFGAFFPLLFVASYRLPGGVAGMIGASQTFLVIGLSWWVLAGRPRTRLIVSAVMAVFGLAIVLAPGFGRMDAIGVAAAFAAAAMLSVATVLLRRWGSPVKPMTLVGWQLTMGGLMILPFAFLEGPLPALSSLNVMGYLYLGLITTALAYACWFRGIERLSPSLATLLGALTPIVAILLGVAFNGEHMSALQIAGVVLTFAAVAVGSTAPADVEPSDLHLAAHGTRDDGAVHDDRAESDDNDRERAHERDRRRTDVRHAQPRRTDRKTGEKIRIHGGGGRGEKRG